MRRVRGRTGVGEGGVVGGEGDGLDHAALVAEDEAEEVLGGDVERAVADAVGGEYCVAFTMIRYDSYS